MSKPLRSFATTQGKKMAGARSLWRANGVKEEHFGKPIIAIANSFTQFVPGHVHLHKIGQYVKSLIEEEGFFAAEFNTIAIDDGIAMGHDGMLYSLPSREIIADSVESMCNAHKVDALICITNCDKITPGMLMATMRLNIPTIFVSGGPMEAGVLNDNKYDLVDAMVKAADPSITEEEISQIEKIACPTCGSCSGMFTANSMNCLTEAIGLALPGSGTIVATHKNRLNLFTKAAKLIVTNTKKYYEQGDESVLPKSIATKAAFMNAMALDIAMGGSTNTILHLLAVANEAEVDFNLKDIDQLSKKVPNLCKVSPSSNYHVEDVNRAGGILGIMGELSRQNLLDLSVKRVDNLSLKEALEQYDILSPQVKQEAIQIYKSAPGNIGLNLILGSQENYFPDLDTDRQNGCLRNKENCYNQYGGLAVLFGNIAPQGSIVKTAGVDPKIYKFKGTAKIFDSQEKASEAITSGTIKPGDIVIIRYEGPKGGPGMQEMLYPTSYLKSMKLDKDCALITDGRFSGGTAGLSICHVSPEAAAQGKIALLEDGDQIEIDIPNRSLEALVSEKEFTDRLEKEKAKGKQAFTPNRTRPISKYLKAYSYFVSSADQGAVKIVPE